ncbi:MAG: cell division protein FtsQ/DivIB [Luteolibacter sp.]
MSPLIAWFGFVSFLKVLGKTAFVLALLAGLAYGVRQAIQHTFHQNPDFRLQAINLTPNNVLNEPDLVDYLNLDLSGNIFDFDIKFMEERLLQIPAISSARVRRDLPGTLEFSIVTRQPVAWIACPQENLPASRENHSILIDYKGFTYPCPPGQVGICQNLPILILSPIPGKPVKVGEKLDHPQFKHCISLLTAIRATYPAGVASIESISKENEWSLSLRTKSGTIATFGLGDHKRQLTNLNQALNHSGKKGYKIATINLIPKQNVPITVAEDNSPPRAIPVTEQLKESAKVSKKTNDLNILLNRN